MANNTGIYRELPNRLLLASVVFKFIAMVIGVLGNVTVIMYSIFLKKRKDSDIIFGWKLGVGRSSRLLDILSNMDH